LLRTTVETRVSPRRSRLRSYAVVIVAALLLAAGLIYYGTVQPNSSGRSTTSSTTNGYSASISALQNEVASLQMANQTLQAEMAALSARANSSSGLSAAKIYSGAKASVVTVQGDEVTVINTFFGPVTSVSSILGSGFVVDYKNSSYIVTNYHVVGGISNLTVTFSDGNSYPAKVVGSDASSDMAVLSLDAPASEFVPLALAGSTQEATVGDAVYAIGNPFGLSGSMTYGIVSQTGRTITESTSNVSIPDILQFSAPINPGNSGGPLFDSSGVVVGMTTAAVTNSQGLGFAIPSDAILRELPSLISNGSYRLHPYLGITGADMSYQVALAAKTKVTYGILVEQVTAGSPAAAAGIRAGNSTVVIGGTTYLVGGDIIVSVNGTKVLNQDGLAAYLEENATAGQRIQLGLSRSGVPTTVTVALGSLPGQ
jgi:S1-C subfamily serine protease